LSPCAECSSCQYVCGLELLLPHLAGAVVENAQVTGAGLCIWARARVDKAACPACGRSSARVHSRYQRRVAAAAIGGRRVMIWLRVRRLFCDEPACGKRTFAKQVPGLTVRYRRKTPLLAEVLRNIAVALAGRAGCRLARALQAMATLAASTINRSDLPKSVGHCFPETIPSARLALHRELRGQKLGSALLVDALGVAARSADDVAAAFVVVDALNDRAAEFYRDNGFRLLPDTRRLVLKMSAIAAAGRA
jgi:GNAT superfamily N-acetyltransferase